MRASRRTHRYWSRMSKMDAYLLELKGSIDRRAIVYVSLSMIMCISIVVVASNNQASLTSLYSWHLNPTDRQQLNRSNEGTKLYKALLERAINRGHRYYLNDFDYFHMIQAEFPMTESAAKLNRSKGLAHFPPSALEPKDVLFIVMGSAKYVDRVRLLTQTWLRWTQGNFVFFTETTNADGQHRRLRGSQWLMANRPELVKRVKWFMVVDDNTWINVPALLSYLQFFDHRMSLSLGYIWNDTWTPGWSQFSEGGGVIFSQAAFVSMVPAMYSKECPFHPYDDVAWMHCQQANGVTKIHSNRFFPDAGRLISPPYRLTPVEYAAKITFYNINNPSVARQVTCDVAAYWKWPIEGCETRKRRKMYFLVFRRAIIL